MGIEGGGRHFSKEWMMRPEEGGRQFSLGQDYGDRGRRQAFFSQEWMMGAEEEVNVYHFFFTFYS
jgi:hypothetical protein